MPLRLQARFASMLEDAQREIRARVAGGVHPYAHPYYWAGFVVSGELR